MNAQIRAMHELERGQMVWGEWSEHSRPFFTDREVQRNVKPAEHIWVLVHGLRGDSDDMKYLANSISSRFAVALSILAAPVRSRCGAFFFFFFLVAAMVAMIPLFASNTFS